MTIHTVLIAVEDEGDNLLDEIREAVGSRLRNLLIVRMVDDTVWTDAANKLINEQLLRCEVSAHRSCGDCTACCTVMGVKSIEKPAYTRCEKLVALGSASARASGCSIYTTRPDDCRDFSCLWLQDDGRVLRNMERPDHVGLMFDVTQKDAKIGQALIARAVRPGAFNEPAAKKLIERLAKRSLIILIDGSRFRQLAGPAHLIEEARKHIKIQEVQS